MFELSKSCPLPPSAGIYTRRAMPPAGETQSCQPSPAPSSTSPSAFRRSADREMAAGSRRPVRAGCARQLAIKTATLITRRRDLRSCSVPTARGSNRERRRAAQGGASATPTAAAVPGLSDNAGRRRIVAEVGPERVMRALDRLTEPGLPPVAAE